MKVLFVSIVMGLTLLNPQAFASETFIDKVVAQENSQGSYRFDVTLAHADKSWDHYANLWQIETLQGEVLGKRVLLHPHISEQPFTRSLTGVQLPKGITQVVIVAGCTVDGINSQRFTLQLQNVSKSQ
ncbi:MAG: hypothetical protein MJK10_00635 [Pseudomonadales bacterium]|nr:hypothetical protein [Pseudomonadales bacterium]NRA14384.1 hypothetical protein [Oceanospirillaceae bacterium]